jgi:uncharacterized protein (DUF58 family)
VFVPTGRLLFVTLCGLVIIVLSPSEDAAVGLSILVLAGAVLLGVVDGLFVPPRRTLLWTRANDAKLSLGAWNPITLTLQNRSGRQVTFMVRDAVPSRLIPRGEAGRGTCEANGTWDLAFAVLPIHRGDYTFGSVGARYRGPLGLVWRQQATRLDGAVTVYPNLLAVRAYESLAQRGRLEELGLRNSRRWGTGTEFERLRDYTSDDEFRRINWPATARQHRPIAVEYQTERSQNVMIVLDAGRLMSTRVPLPVTSSEAAPWREEVSVPLEGGRTTPVALTRLDYSVNAAVLLAFVSQRYGDRVGLLAFSDRILRYGAPAPGRRQFLRLTEMLHNLEPEQTEADYTRGLAYMGTRNRRRSLAVLFTDITEPDAADSLVAQVAHLSRRHLVLTVTLRDPAIDALSGMQPDTTERAYQRAVARQVLDAREETLKRLRSTGVLTLDVSADKLSLSVINRYLEIKARTML